LVIELVPADERWPPDFERIAQVLHQQLGDDARRIDHIGSTSVPGLPSKDVIDVQITAEDEASLGRIVATLDKQGWRRAREFGQTITCLVYPRIKLNGGRRSSTNPLESDPSAFTYGSRAEQTTGTRSSSAITSACIRTQRRHISH
jgi:GrpB-like predicted nucleotidyltransferase (UPF0157 family)